MDKITLCNLIKINKSHMTLCHETQILLINNRTLDNRILKYQILFNKIK